MSVSYSLHFLLAGWSVLAGVLLGFLYEFFKLLHRLHPQVKWLIFLEDLFFSLLCTCAMLLLFFNLSYGRMRLYAFAGVAAGFAGWYFTLGKLFGRAVSRLHRWLRPRWQRIGELCYTIREKKRFCHRARSGFGAGKQIRRKTDAAQS